jgi:hypothetical protein
MTMSGVAVPHMSRFQNDLQSYTELKDLEQHLGKSEKLHPGDTSCAAKVKINLDIFLAIS